MDCNSLRTQGLLVPKSFHEQVMWDWYMQSVGLPGGSCCLLYLGQVPYQGQLSVGVSAALVVAGAGTLLAKVPERGFKAKVPIKNKQTNCK